MIYQHIEASRNSFMEWSGDAFLVEFGSGVEFMFLNSYCLKWGVKVGPVLTPVTSHCTCAMIPGVGHIWCASIIEVWGNPLAMGGSIPIDCEKNGFVFADRKEKSDCGQMLTDLQYKPDDQ